MSSSNRGAARRANDFYQTPAPTTDLILRQLAPEPKGRVLELTCGKGAIMRRLLAYGYQRSNVAGIELDPVRASVARAYGQVLCANALDRANIQLMTQDAGPFDLIVTNPPFDISVELALTAIDAADGRATVAFLLPLPWLGSAKRADLHKAHPCDVYVIPRPEFAASMSCSRKKEGCVYRETLEIEALWSRECPLCSARACRTTTDSIEYMWAVWGPGRGNGWFRLDP